MASYSQEFTPELTSDVLAAELNPIEEQERQEVGNARARGAAAGLIGQASTGTEVAGAQAAAGTARDRTVANFNLDVAKQRYSERMADEARAFQDTERQKQEDFAKQMAIMGYQHDEAAAAGAKHAAQQGQLLGLVGTVGGAAAGSILGPAGSAIGSSLGKSLVGMMAGAGPDGNAVSAANYATLPGSPSDYYSRPRNDTSNSPDNAFLNMPSEDTNF